MTVEEIEALRAKTGGRGGSSLRQAVRLLADRQTREAIRAIPIVTRMEMAARGIARILPDATQHWLRQKVADLMSRSEPADDSGPPPRPLLPRSLVRLYADTTVYSTKKAQRLLGFEPKIGFREGMELTSAWIRWARL
ncbi:MAG: hypothetical protein QN131_05410 [Armatimonadota bacterium]|nr:hypothetical protein [Armatimonadota bacterium]